MLRRLACRTAGRMPADDLLATATPAAALFTFPLLLIAIALVGLGIATHSAPSAAIGAICLVAALSKPKAAHPR
ncbi:MULTISPECIES: hypothetical protein [Pseudomonas]|uniref:Uncharacterized protein n=1 Tax=Pseudomonas quercus TaxID=2722792 RepID=A0ABX0YCS4_9PSED|nr:MULTISPECIES: hypothetical protein [Pseudomonas]MBF7141344.1 hypothetical protein [Pseudomonas sp. LY10J]NJO99882.1 hypothetical protein [Pseudomonas quercus]